MIDRVVAIIQTMRTDCQYWLVNVSSHLENLPLSRVGCYQHRSLFYIEQIPVYHSQNIKTKGKQAQFLGVPLRILVSCSWKFHQGLHSEIYQ